MEHEPPSLDDELERLYGHRFSDEERASKARLWQVLCDTFFSRYVPADGTVLDLGAGYCDFINHVRAARRIAVDKNPDTKRSARDGVEVHEVALADLGDVVSDGSVDLAFASNVFEHLASPDELLRVLAAVRRALKPGGKLLVMQPNVRFVGPAFWDFFDHRLPLTEKGMSEALVVAGFRITEVRARFLPYTTKSRLPQWSSLVRLYLALPLAQRLFGKQMLLVAEREA